MIKRLFLFVLTNILVIITITIMTSIFGIGNYLTPYGIDYKAMMQFCLLWGMGGAFISLWLSRFVAKAFMGIKLIGSGSTEDPRLANIRRQVYALAQKGGLRRMPEVGYYRSREVNAFATGPTKNRSLVAVSTGLIENLDDESIEGVLGHEVAHIVNGDMVTMSLVQGVINAFVMFFARVVAFAISGWMRNEDEGFNFGWMNWIIIIALEIFFSFLGMFVVAGFSRHREFKADEGGAVLAGKDKMIKALSSLRRLIDRAQVGESHQSIATLKISNRPSLLALMSTHPPLAKRIARLEQL